MTEKNPVGRPLKYKTVEEMQKKIDAYFAMCDKKKEPYTITGLALALDFSTRAELINYQDREEYSNAVKKAKLKVEHQHDKLLISKNGQVTGLIFNLKNNFKWRDAVEVEVNKEQDKVFQEDVNQKIKELTAIVNPQVDKKKEEEGDD
jgi:hypothetical protein